MKEKKFEAKLRNIHEVKMPFVKAAFQGKDGNVYIGIMLVDTGCVNCILNRSVVPLLEPGAKREDDVMEIFSIQADQNSCQGYDFTFKMGNEMFTDVFYVNQDFNFDVEIEGFIGIIGYQFLQKHKLVLDYASETLHESMSVVGDPNDYKYFFPMKIGIENYNIPIVGLVKGDKEFIMVADSGANSTLLTHHVLTQLEQQVEEETGHGSVTGFNNKPMPTTIHEVELPLLSIGGTAENPKLYNCKDVVNIIREHKYIIDNIKDPKDNDLPPLSGLLSSAFMLDHRWVLDFGQGVMYSLQTASA